MSQWFSFRYNLNTIADVTLLLSIRSIKISCVWTLDYLFRSSVMVIILDDMDALCGSLFVPPIVERHRRDDYSGLDFSRHFSICAFWIFSI